MEASSAPTGPGSTSQMIHGRRSESSPAAPRRTSGSVDSVSIFMTSGKRFVRAAYRSIVSTATLTDRTEGRYPLLREFELSDT